MTNELDQIINCIKESEKQGAFHKTDVLTGLSGESLFGSLQRLSNLLLDENNCYLEVGVYQGLTLLSSAISNNNSTFYGIDNFAYYDKDNKNKSIVEDRVSKLKLSNVELIDSDYEFALENLEKHIGNKKIKIFFIDGPHDYRSQIMCLLLIKPYLADDAVILIDDSNYRFVRQANRDFLISHPDFKLLFQSYTKAHPANLKGNDLKESKSTWWNGLNIIVKDSKSRLNAFYPETEKDRTLFENHQILDAIKYPEQLLYIHELAKKTGLYSLINLFKKPSKVHSGKYKIANTHSDNIFYEKFNPKIG